MQGKTHMAVGTAAALAIMQPQTVPQIAVGAGAAIIGSLIADADIPDSKARNSVLQVGAALIIIIGGAYAIEKAFHVGIPELILQNSNIYRLIFGVAMFFGLALYSMVQPHRQFTHSFLAMALYSGAVYVMIPSALLYFVIGYASHLLLDLLNYTGERLFFPLKKTYSLKLCKSDGMLNKVLFLLGTAATVILLWESPSMQGFVAKVINHFNSIFH